MKSKKRHQSSSEESEQSDDSVNSSSSSESDSEDSSESEHRHKKKKKRANPSNSDSASEDQRRSKKRKHKKKKKKHSKKKRRSHSEDLSASDNELSSVSDGEVSPKKKRKHKHKHYKRNRSLPDSDIEEVHGDRRLHSVVKERRDSSEGSQPSRTYYQKEYPREEYEREREVQRFYRGSSKELRQHQEPPYYDRERNDRYGSYPQEKYDRNKEKYGNNSHYNVPIEDFNRRQHEFDQYKRHQRYNEHRYQEEYSRRPREDNNHPREDTRGYRYNQYEGQKRREYDEGREYRERRGPPENVNYRDRAYPDKREKYRDDGYSQERPREPVRRERPTRPEKPLPPPQRGHSRSRSPDGRFREKRIEIRSEKEESRPIRDRPREDRVREDRPREERPREEKPREERLREERPREERPREERPREDRRAPATENKPRERKTRFGDANDKEYSWGKEEVKKEGQKDPADKEKPNFGLSGKLTADQNTVNGVVIKYSEPDDAKQPKRRWRFYPFKGDKAMPILYIHRQSAFLIGRDKKVADIALDHPSISKQHAALQYRATPFTRPDGSQGRRVRPYIIDLESANGTFVNNKKIEPRRYVELLERDVVKFGFSQREYVLLHENSKDEAQDDDHIDPPDIGDNITTTEQIKQEKRVKQEVAEDGE